VYAYSCISQLQCSVWTVVWFPVVAPREKNFRQHLEYKEVLGRSSGTLGLSHDARTRLLRVLSNALMHLPHHATVLVHTSSYKRDVSLFW
jgi:hypothetical protein